MSKKLKIKFWKAEKALAMQILEQEGLPNKKVDGFVFITNFPEFYRNQVNLRGTCSECDLYISTISSFRSNPERDKYLDIITNAITDELFTSNGELRVGEMCEVRDYEHKKWETRRLLAILPTHIKMPFIVERPNNNAWFEEWRHARPLAKHTEPKVETNGEIITYTWEEK